MRRDPRAYRIDVVSACDAILDATREIGLETYLSSRLIRSSVERVEAATALWSLSERLGGRLGTCYRHEHRGSLRGP